VPSEVDPSLYQMSCKQQTEAPPDDRRAMDNARNPEQKDIFGRPALALLIVLHNGFYAFSFEIVVLTTCMSTRQAHFSS
jgi:hypothetical protein